MPITIENKCGLILGVANERSIAWGISKVLSNSGAEIALSYQNAVSYTHLTLPTIYSV